jgi:hypothetical protein
MMMLFSAWPSSSNALNDRDMLVDLGFLTIRQFTIPMGEKIESELLLKGCYFSLTYVKADFKQTQTVPLDGWPIAKVEARFLCQRIRILHLRSHLTKV